MVAPCGEGKVLEVRLILFMREPQTWSFDTNRSRAKVVDPFFFPCAGFGLGGKPAALAYGISWLSDAQAVDLVTLQVTLSRCA